jgi:hypothetical protein
MYPVPSAEFFFATATVISTLFVALVLQTHYLLPSTGFVRNLVAAVMDVDVPRTLNRLRIARGVLDVGALLVAGVVLVFTALGLVSCLTALLGGATHGLALDALRGVGLELSGGAAILVRSAFPRDNAYRSGQTRMRPLLIVVTEGAAELVTIFVVFFLYQQLLPADYQLG